MRPLNIVVVLVDSLNRRSLSCYDPSITHTPELDRFAATGVRFDDAFVGSLPCMPARRDLFTGRQELLWRPWGPLEVHDPRLPLLLAAQGYTTGIVTDHYHYWEEHGNGYLQGFQSAEFIRGHEIDFWNPPPPAGSSLPAWVQRNARWRPGWAEQYHANVADFSDEEDFFAAKVFGAASRWIERHGRSHGPFYLQVESFDVHEPFHVPEPYRSAFGDADGDDRFTNWPPYQNSELARQFIAEASPEELAHIRARYAAKVAMVDRWFGHLLRTLDEQGLTEETVVVFTTDHGHDLGERGAFGKSDPHYDDHANIPLIIRHPQARAGARDCLTAPVDIFATLLDVAGASLPEGTEGSSLLPVLFDPSATVRDHVLFGTYGQGLCLTDGEWTLLKAPVAEGPLYAYSTMQFRSMMVREVRDPVAEGYFIPGVPFRQWKVPVREPGHACMQASPRSAMAAGRDMLFDRRRDHGQTMDRWNDPTAADQRARMLGWLTELLREAAAPPEQYARMGLDSSHDGRQSPTTGDR
jgi:arylsulfatase A-like enzyme